MPRYDEFIQDVLISLHANITDLRQRRAFADAGELPHIEARLAAYEEVVQIFRESAKDFNIPYAN